MKTLDMKTITTTQSRFCVEAFAENVSTDHEVADCASPLALLQRKPIKPTSVGESPPPQTLSRTLVAVCLCLAWFALPGSAPAQPNYSNAMEVVSYVRQMLYWPDAHATNKNIAAFRYKHLLYTNDGGIRSDFANMVNLYGGAERATSAVAEAHLRRGVTNNPNSTLLHDLLLDLYYDRTVAEAILAREAVQKAERAHYGLPISPYPVPVDGFIIDNEIDAYTSALQSSRLALATYCALLTNSLGVLDLAETPLGYRIFQERVPVRGLYPAGYLSNGAPVSVTGDTDALFSGYKDLVLLYELLRDQGRIAATLARLRLTRNGSVDPNATEALITETKRSLFLHTHALRTAFPNLQSDDPAVSNSGLASALAGVSDSLMELDRVNQYHRGQLNPLGFEPDFLVLVQGAFASEVARDDTYDAFVYHLRQPGSVLDQAATALEAARDSYTTYRGWQDQLEDQFNSSTITYFDRLRDIVGYFPYDAEYASNPRGAPGSELDQQYLSIEAARLQIRKNQAEIANLNQQCQYEINKAISISDVYVQYGNKQAAITEWIGLINGVQAAANEFADVAENAGGAPPNFGGGVGHAVNAVVQYAAEAGKGLLEAQKERLAAQQNAVITGLEASTTVSILMLQMNTLAVDSLSAAVQLRKDLNRLQDLYREKDQLERNLKEKDQNLTRRYFADPVHRLCLHADMIQADLKFREAQQWLFFMARALEYKWNEPFIHEYSGQAWRLADLFKLRNADELRDVYDAMRNFDDEAVLSSRNDDRFDWFSVRENFLGYRRYDTNNQPIYYVDPPTGETVDAVTIFRRALARLATNNVIYIPFSTVRQNHNTFFIEELYLDKILWLKIRLPGYHTTTNFTGWQLIRANLVYGGLSYMRNPFPGSPDPQRPDRLVNEWTAYSTRLWYRGWMGTNRIWRFKDGITNTVSLYKAPAGNVDRDPFGFPNDIVDSAWQMDTLKERSVAADQWRLEIPIWDPINGPLLRIDELEDIEIYFRHATFERQ